MTITFFEIVFPWMGKITFFIDRKKNHENDSWRWKSRWKTQIEVKSFAAEAGLMNSEHESCHCWCTVPKPGETPQDPHGCEGEEDRVGTRILWMTDIFLEILGAHRVTHCKPRIGINTFLCPFRWSKCSRSENVALQKECDSALWLIYSPHLVKRKNRGTGVEPQAGRGQQNNVLTASCQNLAADRFPRLPGFLIINSFR